MTSDIAATADLNGDIIAENIADAKECIDLSNNGNIDVSPSRIDNPSSDGENPISDLNCFHISPTKPAIAS
jgi:hypothetical protein